LLANFEPDLLPGAIGDTAGSASMFKSSAGEAARLLVNSVVEPVAVTE
jgi:hypothetical protein